MTINRVTRCGGCCAAGSLLAGPTPQPGSGPPSPEVQTCGRLSVWRARPASREPGLPRASALAASSRSAVPALARAPRSWPRVGASRTAASPVFLGPVPRGNPPRPRGARGWARPHLLWSRLAVEGVRAPRWWSVPCGRGVVGVAVDEGRSVALRWLSVCGGASHGEEDEEGDHQTEESHGLRQGKPQNGIGEELLLERWVPGIANNQATKHCANASS